MEYKSWGEKVTSNPKMHFGKKYLITGLKLLGFPMWKRWLCCECTKKADEEDWSSFVVSICSQIPQQKHLFDCSDSHLELDVPPSTAAEAPQAPEPADTHTSQLYLNELNVWPVIQRIWNRLTNNNPSTQQVWVGVHSRPPFDVSNAIFTPVFG